MKVIINPVRTPPPPPATYDLIGLSPAEMAIITALLGSSTQAAASAILKAAGLPNEDKVSEQLYNSVCATAFSKNMAGYEVKVILRDEYNRLLYRDKQGGTHGVQEATSP